MSDKNQATRVTLSGIPRKIQDEYGIAETAHAVASSGGELLHIKDSEGRDISIPAEVLLGQGIKVKKDSESSDSAGST
jgi:hypothetical protein